MRYALGIEYDGSAYMGFQRQRHGRSIQAELERALSRIADAEITVHCAGRTDAGVHATGQVIHFDSPVPRPERAWILGANSHLPDDIAVFWAVPVEQRFHARYCACARRYRYTIVNRPYRPALAARQQAWVREPLDVSAMQAAATHLLGRHDFTSFRSVACQAKSAVKTITELSLVRSGDLIMVDVQADAFLHHMVRNIVGSLLPIGRGEWPVERMAELLEARDRSLAGITAPAHGLCLTRAFYPEGFGLPAEHCLRC